MAQKSTNLKSRSVSIDETSLTFSCSRSSGPGGQNVNKLNTKVTVLLDIGNCASLDDKEKKQIIKKLSSRINKDGLIRVVCQKNRTQKANRQQAIEKLNNLLNAALKPKPIRKKTKVPHWAAEKRLEKKKKRGFLKQQRAHKEFAD